MASVRSLAPTNGSSSTREESAVCRLDRGARELRALDDPFEAADAQVTALVARFTAHLRSRGVGEIFIPSFAAEARAFRARFHRASLEEFDAPMLELYLEEGRLQSLGERALRNRAIAAKALLDFLVAERRPAPPLARSVDERRPAPPPAFAPRHVGERRPAPPPVAPPVLTARRNDKRRHERVAFIADVRVEHYGVHRSADISVGGIYLEKLTMVSRGDVVRLVFKLASTDPESVVARARACFVHPQFGAGLDFVELSPADAKRIADYVGRNR